MRITLAGSLLPTKPFHEKKIKLLLNLNSFLEYISSNATYYNYWELIFINYKIKKFQKEITTEKKPL